MRTENISHQMERTMIETWSSMRRLDYEPSAAEVRASVVRQLEKQGYTEHELPKLRTFQEYIRRARKRNLALQTSSDVDQSLPWNIDIFDDKNCYIPPDTIPFVLQLWRYSKNLGPDLTIRQAKWATRLSHLLKDLDIAEQWIHVVRYSREEELSILSGTEMRTDQLNSMLVMEPWERMTLHETDVTFKANRRINHTFISYSADGGIIEEFYYAFADIANTYLQMVLEDKLPRDYERVDKLNELIASLPASSKYFPDFESRFVYLRHLAKLSHLPYFKTAEPEQIHALIIDLRNWTTSLAQEKIKAEINPHPNSSSDYLPRHRGGFPLDIYLRAGFSLEEDTRELEAQLKKLHPDSFKQKGDNS